MVGLVPAAHSHEPLPPRPTNRSACILSPANLPGQESDTNRFCESVPDTLSALKATRADYEAAERDRPKLSEDDLQRAENGPTYTTAELIQHLESL